MDDLDPNIGLNIGFDTDFHALFEGSTTGAAPISHHQDVSAPSSSGSGCSKCAKYREDIQRLEKEHRVNFLLLKKKVISTDMIIRRFKAKQDEADTQAKTVLTLKHQLENANRDTNILSEQLKSAMESMKPMKEEKEILETALREKSGEIVSLTDRLHAEEALRNQRTSVAQRNLELEDQKIEMERRIKSLETRNKSLQSSVKKLESEKKSLTSQGSITKKRLNKLALLLNSAQNKVDMMWKQLSTAGVPVEGSKPALIPKAVKFLITEALKARTEMDKTKKQKGNGEDDNDVDWEDKDLDGDAANDVENGYDEENDDSDFDNVSDLDLSDESMGGVPSTPCVPSKNAPGSVDVSSKDSEEANKANSAFKQSLKKSVKDHNMIRDGMNKTGTPQKSNSAGNTQKTVESQNSGNGVKKLSLEHQGKGFVNGKSYKKAGRMDGSFNSTDSEDESNANSLSKARKKFSPNKKIETNKTKKTNGVQKENLDKSNRIKKSPLVKQSCCDSVTRPNDVSTEDLDRDDKTKGILGVKTQLPSSKTVEDKLGLDLSSDESSLCSLPSDDESLLDQGSHALATLSKEEKEEKLPLGTKNNEKVDQSPASVHKKDKLTPQTLPAPSSPAVPSSSSSSSNESDEEEGSRSSSRGLYSRMSSIPDDTAPGATTEHAGRGEDVSLHDIFSFMSSLSPLSPMPLTPCPRSRTVSEATSIDDMSDVQPQADPVPSEDQQRTNSSMIDEITESCESKQTEASNVNVLDESRSKSSITGDLDSTLQVEVEGVDRPVIVETKERNLGGNMVRAENPRADQDEESGVSLSGSDLSIKESESELSGQVSAPALNPGNENGETVVSRVERCKGADDQKKEAVLQRENTDFAIIPQADVENEGVGDGNKKTSTKNSDLMPILRLTKARGSLGFIPTNIFANEINLGSGTANEDPSEGGSTPHSHGEEVPCTPVKSLPSPPQSPGTRACTRNQQDAGSSSSQKYPSTAKSSGQKQEDLKLSGDLSSRRESRESEHNLINLSTQSAPKSCLSSEEPALQMTKWSTRSESMGALGKEEGKKSEEFSETQELCNDKEGIAVKNKSPLSLVELYVVKSPSVASVSSQREPKSSCSQVSADSYKTQQVVSPGINKLFKNPSEACVTPPRQLRRRSRRLSDASDTSEQESLGCNRSLEQRAPGQEERLEQSAHGLIEGSSSDNVRNSRDMSQSSADLQSSIERNRTEAAGDHQGESKVVRQRMRTRSSSVTSNTSQEGCDIDCPGEPMTVARSRRSSRLSASAEKLKPQEAGHSVVDMHGRSNQSDGVHHIQSPPVNRSNWQHSAKVVENKHPAKAEEGTTKIDAPSIPAAEQSETLCNDVIKCEASLSEDETVPCIKFGGQSVPPMQKSSNLPLENNKQDMIEEKPIVLSQGDDLSDREHKTCSGVQASVGKRSTRSKYRRSSQTLDNEQPVAVKEEKEEDAGHAESETAIRSLERTSEKDKETSVAERRPSSAITRSTQMEIAAQQLARMLAAAKSTQKKKAELSLRRSAVSSSTASKAQGNVGTEEMPKKRGRGRPRKVPLTAEKVDASSSISTTAEAFTAGSSPGNGGVEDSPKRGRGRPRKKSLDSEALVDNPSMSKSKLLSSNGASNSIVIKSSDNVVIEISDEKTSNGPSNKVSLVSGKVCDVTPSKLPTKPNVRRKKPRCAINKGEGDSVRLQGNSDSESDLDTSSLSSDSEMENIKSSKALCKTSGPDQSPLKETQVSSTFQEGTNNGTLRQEHHVPPPSTLSPVLPTLSSSDSEAETHLTNLETNLKHHPAPGSGGERLTNVSASHAKDSLLPASSLHSEEESDMAKSVNQSLESSVINKLIGDETKAPEEIVEEHSKPPARPRSGRGRKAAMQSRAKPGKTPQGKITSIRIDNGDAAKTIGDMRIRSKKLVVSSSDDEEKDNEGVEDHTSKLQSKMECVKNIKVPKRGDAMIGSRVKSKEFISSSSEDDDEEKIGCTGKQVNNAQTRAVRNDMKRTNGNESSTTPVRTVRKTQAKRLHSVPHLTTSFVPSQFSAFQAVESPKPKANSGPDAVDPLPSPLLKQSSESVPAAGVGCETKHLEQFVEGNNDRAIGAVDLHSDSVPAAVVGGESRKSALCADPIHAAYVDNVNNKTSEQKSLSSTLSEARASSKTKSNSDVLANGPDGGQTDRTSENFQPGSDEEEPPLRIEVGEEPERATDSEVLCGVKEASTYAADTVGVSASKPVIVCDRNSEVKSQPKAETVDKPSFIHTKSLTQTLPDVIENSRNGSKCSSLWVEITNGDVDTHLKQVEEKESNYRKRKIVLPETSCPISTNNTDPQNQDEDSSELCQLTLQDIFTFFRIPRCLSPLPRSPTPKKFCGDCRVSQSSSDTLLTFSSDAPDKATMVAPIATGNSPHTRHSTEGDGHGILQRDISDTRREEQHHDARDSGKNGCRAQGLLSSASSGQHQSKIGGSASASLSHQMMQARKLLTARKKSAEARKQNPAVISSKKAKIEVNNEQDCVQGKKKKMAPILGKFITPYAAVLHDIKVFVEQGGDVAAVAASVLTRVEGREVRPVWAMLPHLLLECMKGQKEEDVLSQVYAACEKTGTIIEAVFVTNAELRLARLISCLSAMDKNLDNASVMGAIWNEVFRQDAKRSPHTVLSFCRLFTLLCMDNGDVEQARVLVYSMAWCGYLPLWPCLAAVAGVWPVVLSSSPSSSCQPIMQVLACILRNSYQEDAKTLTQVCRVTQRLCQWEVSDKSADANSLLKSLQENFAHLADLTDRSAQDRAFATQKAMELLLIFKGAEWVEEHFHKRMLTSVAMRWETCGGEETGPRPALVIGVFKVFRSVLRVLPLTPTAAKHIVGQVFVRCLQKTKGPLDVDLVLLESLLDLSAHDPLRSSEILRTWQNANPGKMTPELFSKVQETRSLLAQLLKEEEKGGSGPKGAVSVPAAKVTNTQQPSGNRGERGRPRGGSWWGRGSSGRGRDSSGTGRGGPGRGRGGKKGLRGRGKN